MHRSKTSLLSLVTIIILGGIGLLAAETSSVARVPDKDRSKSNPYQGQVESAAAGHKLFDQHCASCHGSLALGRGRHPNLHSETVRNATTGELEWLLTNGSLKKGMPSWSKLPDQQRWQLVTYLKTLQ